MICPRCGGTIRQYETCDTCGVSYDEMIDSISHDEMKKLFKRVSGMIENHEDISIEESLLAVELKNSSLLVPLKRDDETLAIKTVEDKCHRMFLPVFTDKEAYENAIKDIDPFTNHFGMIVNLLDDNFADIVINMDEIACELPRKFLEKYFKDNLV